MNIKGLRLSVQELLNGVKVTLERTRGFKMHFTVGAL